MQHASQRLTAKSFLSSEVRRLSRVVAYSPHVRDVAMLFERQPDDGVAGGWSRFFTALLQAAARVEKTTARWRFRPFFNVSPHADNAAWRELHKLALAECARAGRNKVALLTGSGGGTLGTAAIHGSNVRGLLLDAVLKHGVICKPAWIQVCDPRSAEGVCGVAELLFGQDQGERPDALIVADDHAVGPAIAGLLSAGCRVPDDVLVVAHANFPNALETPVPVRGVGFDVDLALAAAAAA